MDGALYLISFFENSYGVGSIRASMHLGGQYHCIFKNFTFRSIYYESSNIFLSFLEVFQLLKRRHLLTNYRFWPDLRIWDGLRIGSSIEYLITYIFTNIKVDHFLNFDMLREAFSSRFFRLDLVLWKKWVFFSPPDKDLASLVFRPFLKGSLNRYARILKWSLSIDYCIE